MSDEITAAKLAEHDRHLDKLSSSVEILASTANKTNEKLDAVVEVMSKQNVLIEKMSSLGRSVDTIRDTARATERVVNQLPDIADIKSSVKITQNLPTGATVKWGIAMLVTYLAASGNYIIGHIHELEKYQESHEGKAELIIKGYDDKIEKIENTCEDMKKHINKENK